MYPPADGSDIRFAPERRSTPMAEQPDRGPSPAYPGMPRWVKLSGIVALALALLVVAVMAVAGGEHGPGRHAPSAGQVTQKP
jgi:hypothetical protein